MCPVQLWKEGVHAVIQQGFLEVVAMGLLSEPELGEWKGRAFQVKGTAHTKVWRSESRPGPGESADVSKIGARL